jgi:uncharacterized protein YegP (UPF0339 family)
MAMTAYFTVKVRRNALGQRRWMWNLHSINGEIVCTSEQYNSHAAALGGIEAVRQHAAGAELRFE